jgi:hypothetical protein
MTEETEKQRLPRSHGVQPQRMAGLGSPHLPVASPRAARAALRHPSAQRLWRPGRLTPLSPYRPALAKTARHRGGGAVTAPRRATSPARPRGSPRPARPVPTWGARHRLGRLRLERVGPSARLCWRGMPTPQALDEAARLAGRHPSQGSQGWHDPANVARSTRERLAKKPAQHVATARPTCPGRPGPRARIVARTRPPRARRPPEHAKRCQPGPGVVSGQPGPPSAVIIPARLRPLRPLPFSRHRDCREQALAEQPAPARGLASRRQWDLGDDSGS